MTPAQNANLRQPIMAASQLDVTLLQPGHELLPFGVGPVPALRQRGRQLPLEFKQLHVFGRDCGLPTVSPNEIGRNDEDNYRNDPD
jgi:hypothetical protein